MTHPKLMQRERAGRLHAALVVLLFAALTAGAASGAASKPLVAIGGVETSPGLRTDLDRLPAIAPYGAFVHFESGTPAEHRTLLEGHGLTVTADFESTAQAVFAVGTVGEIRALTREPSISYLEKNRKLAYHGDTAVWASRSRVAQEAVSGGPYREGDGDVLTGEGVGVAIVDSGINANHPDLTNRVGRNFKIVCTTPGLIDTETGQCFGPLEFVDVGNTANTDTTSGHGTHVSGIVAGDGTQSTGTYPVASAAPNVKGTFTGVAPGATLHGFSTGEVIVVLYAAEAWQYIFDHYDEFNPRIKLVNNSFGEPGGASYDPNSIDAKLVKALVEQKGVTFAFSAGNSGGNGSADTTSSFCDDPTPGVICVANYDDSFPGGGVTGHGNRDGLLNSSSSRGQASSSNTWPDISAPGTFYTAACVRGLQPVCATGIVDEVRWGPWYGTISGTSMSSPHTAGVAALLLQARPDLTPGAIEDVLLDTAYKFTAGTPYSPDPQNEGQTTSFDKGAGLVDVPAALSALGVAHSGGGGGSTGDPQVRITDPQEGSTFDGSGSIPVQGTADDGTPSGVAPAEQVILDGDADPALPGAADIVKLTVRETAAGVSPAGLTYRITVRNAADFGGAPSITLRVTQNVNGRPFLTNVVATPAAVSAGSATPASAVASSVSRSGNTITFFVPLSGLGNPPAGSPGHNVFASAFIGVIVDLAPSPATGAGADVLVRPMYGKPYTIQRPQVVTPPSAAVTLAVDGGSEQTAALAGSSPSYSWSSSVDLSTLPEGAHTLTARLYLDTVLRATHTITIFVDRTPEFSYDVVITSPNDGDIMPRATVQVRGTSVTDDPSTDRRVTLEVLGPEPLPETTASGTAPWSLDVNFDRAPGAYTLLARFYVDGEVKATHSVEVIVPPPAGDGVSCAPRTIGFWRAQFDDRGGGSRKFTSDETALLADQAVRLSDGYFSTRDELVTSLNAKGNAGAEQRAARQFAALLLNLAGGDLSATMSYQAGLSGSEALDPSVYDTATVGPTVDTAKAWIRRQLPDGDLGGANEVADAINNGHGLICG